MQTTTWEKRKRKQIKPAEVTLNVQTLLKRTIFYAPILIILFCTTFLIIPATRNITLWMLAENHPVEMLTFVVAVTGGILGSVSARRAWKHGDGPLVYGLYALLSLFLFFVGLEEVSWGQQLLGFDSPTAWRIINLQGETTLHNVSGLQGHSEIFRFMFGFGGLVGVWLYNNQYFRKIGAPADLLSWFIVITIHAGIDVYNDYFPITRRFDFYVHETSELIEMLIVFSGLIYVALNYKRQSITLKERRAV